MSTAPGSGGSTAGERRLSFFAGFSSLFAALTTLLLVVPTVMSQNKEIERGNAEIAKLRKELVSLDAQAENLRLNSALLVPSFDYQYFGVRADRPFPTVAAERPQTSTIAWFSPVRVPSFGANVATPPIPTGVHTGVVTKDAELSRYFRDPNCQCPQLLTQIEDPNLINVGQLKWLYLGILQKGKVAAIDIRVTLRKFSPGAIPFSIDDGVNARTGSAEDIEVSVGYLETGEGRLIPLASVVTVATQVGSSAEDYTTNIGIGYQPISISWAPLGGGNRVNSPIRRGLANAVLLEGGLEGKG